jgi:diguanylate cyclase (GGDEF)-like protein
MLRRSVAAHEPFGIVMIDLDEFKAVNDSLGHQAGDRLLREAARAIQGAGRDSDSTFRYGGDEFAVLLPHSDAHGLHTVAERIRAAVEAVGASGSTWANEGLNISTSIGTSSYPLDGDTAEAVLLAADRACFVAKRRGRGRVATASEGLALAGEFTLSEPTPVDPPTVLA